MQTIVYFECANGEITYDEPALKIGQELNIEMFMAKQNKNRKPEWKYTKPLLVETYNNFHSYHEKKEITNIAIAVLKNKQA